MSSIDWNDVSKAIPGFNDENSPLKSIKICLEEIQDEDPYDQIGKRLDRHIQELQDRLQETSR